MTKKCPFCGEEIAVTAQKCKHCGEWLEQTVEKSSNWGTRLLKSIIFGAVGWACFYFGSWHLIIGQKISLMSQYLSSGKLALQDFIWEDDGVVFRIDEKYYGFVKNSQFFDSPFIQWIMLGLSIGAFVMALEMLIFGYTSDD
jgi:hypothetical protein